MNDLASMPYPYIQLAGSTEKVVPTETSPNMSRMSTAWQLSNRCASYSPMPSFTEATVLPRSQRIMSTMYFTSHTIWRKKLPFTWSTVPSTVRTFFWYFAFLQEAEKGCNASKIRVRLALWVVRHYVRGPVESVIKTSVVLLTETANVQERCLTSYATIVNYLPKIYTTCKNILTVQAMIRSSNSTI